MFVLFFSLKCRKTRKTCLLNWINSSRGVHFLWSPCIATWPFYQSLRLQGCYDNLSILSFPRQDLNLWNILMSMDNFIWKFKKEEKDLLMKFHIMMYIANVHVPICVLSSNSLKICSYNSSNTDRYGVVVNWNERITIRNIVTALAKKSLW